MASRRGRLTTATAVLLALVVALLSRVPEEPEAGAVDFTFVDIPPGVYYELAVVWMVQNGITTGTSVTTYSPDQTVTRGQMAAFLYRFAAVADDYPHHPFVDVDPAAYYDDAVSWLLFFGITTGTSPSTYSPDQPVTRGQMAAFLYRLAGSPEVTGSIPFADVPAGVYYHDPVRWLHATGITTGTTPTTYSPDEVVTRAQMAALLWRFAGEPDPFAQPLPSTTTTTASTNSTTTTIFSPDPGDNPSTTTTAKPAGDYVRIVSIPDFFNTDIGTIVNEHDPSSDGYGDSRTYELDRSVWYILESIEADAPDFVMVAGDLVNGHWNTDVFDRRVFGPTGTISEQAAAIDRAGDVYYSQWLDRFDQRGLDVYPAVGDHELGDNDWDVGSDKAALLPTFRDEFAQHFTRNPNGTSRYGGTVTASGVPARPPTSQWSDTAYAFEHDNVLVITLDVFHYQSQFTLLDERTGTVKSTVRDTQLRWVEDLLEAADADPAIDHVIVQGHTPVLRPVRERATSQLYIEDDNTGVDTELWRLFDEHDVALYLSGEVHDVTASRSGGTHQVVHGGIIGFLTPVNYLVIDVYDDHIEMEIKEIDVVNTTTLMWQTRQMTTREIRVLDNDWRAGFRRTGTLEIQRQANGDYTTTSSSGKLACFGTCSS